MNMQVRVGAISIWEIAKLVEYNGPIYPIELISENGMEIVPSIFDGILWRYAMIFVLAATPWIELLLVIPVGVAMGLAPLPVAVAVFTGNALPVFLIVLGYDWWLKRHQSTHKYNPPGRRGVRWNRALGIWDKYGLPGLAMAGPLLTGIHLATIIALFFNPERRKLLFWMSFSLFVWTFGTVVVCYTGLEVFHRLLSQ